MAVRGSSYSVHFQLRIVRVEWAIDNGKHDYAKETVFSVSEELNSEIS